MENRAHLWKWRIFLHLPFRVFVTRQLEEWDPLTAAMMDLIKIQKSLTTKLDRTEEEEEDEPYLEEENASRGHNRLKHPLLSPIWLKKMLPMLSFFLQRFNLKMSLQCSGTLCLSSSFFSSSIVLNSSDRSSPPDLHLLERLLLFTSQQLILFAMCVFVRLRPICVSFRFYLSPLLSFEPSSFNTFALSHSFSKYISIPSGRAGEHTQSKSSWRHFSLSCSDTPTTKTPAEQCSRWGGVFLIKNFLFEKYHQFLCPC